MQLDMPETLKALCLLYIDEIWEMRKGGNIEYSANRKVITLPQKWMTVRDKAFGVMRIDEGWKREYVWIFQIRSKPESCRSPLNPFNIGVARGDEIICMKGFDNNDNDQITMRVYFTSGYSQRYIHIEYKVNNKPLYGTNRFVAKGEYKMVVELISGFDGHYPSLELRDYYGKD